MKLRNNFNVSDRIIITRTNKNNPLRKNDLGRLGRIKDVRNSFCIVHLDADDRDKNYIYTTFDSIKLYKVDEKVFDNEPELLTYVADKHKIDHSSIFLDKFAYDKQCHNWKGIVHYQTDTIDTVLETVQLELNGFDAKE